MRPTPPDKSPHRITRMRLLVVGALAAVTLLGVSWRLGWFRSEPSRHGKTVTE